MVFLNARALASRFPFTAVAVFVPLVSLAGMVPVSVNGLGVREALYILLFGRHRRAGGGRGVARAAVSR